MKIKILFLATLLFTPGLLFAQGTPPATPPAAGGEAKPDATPKPLQILKPGVVASSGKYSKVGTKINQQDDGSVPAGKNDIPSPVTGSVKNIGPNRCAAVLSNGSDDATFSVSFELSQSTKETIKSPRKRYFSAVLGPKKSVEREFRCEAVDILQMSLKSGKEIRSN